MKVPATDTIIWQIDGEGTVLGFIHNNEVYYYLKNAQGDIVSIADKDSNVVANYTYDSWGKIVSIIDPSQDNLDVTGDTNHIGYINPLRYRGYYYDSETGLYYLNARYYDPETCRFINSDNNLEGGLNLFEYCYNNPINMVDCGGDAPQNLIPTFMYNYAVKKIIDATLVEKISKTSPIYHTVKSILLGAGIAALKLKKCPISQAMYSWGMIGNGGEMPENIKKLLIKKYKNSKILKEAIRKNLGNNQSVNISQMDINFKGEDDLFFSMGKCNLSFSGSKKKMEYGV